jgi:predicted nuclease with RNAse H fold
MAAVEGWAPLRKRERRHYFQPALSGRGLESLCRYARVVGVDLPLSTVRRPGRECAECAALFEMMATVSELP